MPIIIVDQNGMEAEQVIAAIRDAVAATKETGREHVVECILDENYRPVAGYRPALASDSQRENAWIRVNTDGTLDAFTAYRARAK